MAETYNAGSDPAAETEPKRPGFHYYSGGEIKELEHTRVSPLLWAGWTVVIVAAVIYLLVGGALGPHSPISKPFIPTGSTAPVQARIQQDLTKQMYGNETAQQADMRQLTPFLGGESLTMAVTHGGATYQNYCIGCHGPNQDGNGVNASSLNPKPRNLHDGPFMRETLNYQRINTSLHYGVHGTAMPRWENTLREHEIQEVIAYVLSLTWTMPPSADMDTSTGQLATPPAAPTSPDANGGMSGPGKSPSGSTTGTPGGSSVHGGSVSTSPEPITPTVEGNPAASTSTAPPSQSGSSVPGSTDTNAPAAGDQSGGPKAPPTVPLTAPPGYAAPGGTR